MAGWDDSIFDNLPGSPPRPQPPPARGLRKDLFPVNPGEVIGGLQQLAAQGAGNAVAYIGGHPAPLPSTSYWVQPESVEQSANRLGRDVAARIEQSPEGPSLPKATTLAAAPLAIAAASKLAPEARTAEEIATGAQAAKAAPPIIAYHGSPYKFDKFDPSKIGTGEGAQAYGHGLYFAESEPVAQSYKTSTSDLRDWPVSGENPNWRVPSWVGKTASASPQGLDSVIEDFSNRAAQMKEEGHWNAQGIQDIVDALQAVKAGKAELQKPGHMYQVGINADPNAFIDYDKPLKEQSESVKNALAQTPWKDPYTQNTLTGGDIVPRTPEEAEQMRSAGIPGIKYPDQGSRGSGGGTSNYVVFDPNTVEILKRYGLAGMLAPAGAGAATLSVLGQPGSGVTLNNTQPPPDQQQQQFF